MKYKKQVQEIESEIHAERFRDGMKYGYELLLSKIDLPFGLELTVPKPPLGELVLPEKEELPLLEQSAADPNVAPSAPEATLTNSDRTIPKKAAPLFSHEKKENLFLNLLVFGWTTLDNRSLPFQGYVINYLCVTSAERLARSLY